VLEEADETVFWLELFQEGSISPAEKLRDLIKEANELVSIFVSSVRTAKEVRGQIAEVGSQEVSTSAI